MEIVILQSLNKAAAQLPLLGDGCLPLLWLHVDDKVGV